MKQESPSEYINKHTIGETVDEEKIKRAKEALSKPIGEVKWAESGIIKVENIPFVMEFSYVPISEEIAKSIWQDPRRKNINLDTLREITTWTLTREDNGATLSLSDILPEGYRVFFSTVAQDGSSYVVMDESGGTVVLNAEITKPEMIIHLLHEAGHVHEKTDEMRFSPTNNPDVSSKVYKGDLAVKLLSERNAWAYALRRLKPFVDQEPTSGFSIQKNDVLTLANNWALKSYQDSIKDETSSRVAMSHFNQDYDYMFEDSDRFES